MIWHLHDSSTGSEDEPGLEVLAGLDEEGCALLNLNPHESVELAKAVSLAASTADDDHDFDERSLTVLASRALSSIGQAEAARRMYLFGSGVIRQAEWHVSGDRCMWILDLMPLTEQNAWRLEMTFFSGISSILEAVCDVWDGTDGTGVLGLLHLKAAVDNVAGGANRSRRKSMATEVRSLCAARLRRVAETRGWRDVPEVIGLDL